MSTQTQHQVDALDQHAFTVLFICTGNICRSPVAQTLLRRDLDQSVAILSAGTHTTFGRPVDAKMAHVMTDNQLTVPGIASIPLTAAMIEGADLILALTTAHRAEAVYMVPSAVRRTFTLREFERLVAAHGTAVPLGSTDAARLQALIPLAIAQRAHLAIGRHQDDVFDPIGRSRNAHRRAYREIDTAVTTITQALHLPTDPDSASSLAKVHQLLPRRLGPSHSARAGI